mgnify:CR=1 FL=1
MRDFDAILDCIVEKFRWTMKRTKIDLEDQSSIQLILLQPPDSKEVNAYATANAALDAITDHLLNQAGGLGEQVLLKLWQELTNQFPELEELR